MVSPPAFVLILIAFLVVDGGVTASVFPRNVAFSIALWAFATAFAVAGLSALMQVVGMKKSAVLVTCVVALCLFVLTLTVFAAATGHIAVIALTSIFILSAAGGIITALKALLSYPAQTG